MENKKDTYSHKGWLTSDNLIKRSFAVLGHAYLANLIIWVGFLVIFLGFGLIAWLISLAF